MFLSLSLRGTQSYDRIREAMKITRGAILTGAARQQAKPGRGDERFKLIPQRTGEALIPDQNAGL